jgi:6,7-dimethyl-8-ribityllumazine synthase
MTTFEGALDGAGLRIAIVVARFNEFVSEKLLSGALQALERHGVDRQETDIVWVPGSFELPLVARRLESSGGYDAVLCLGAVIRGETAHFDFVAAETAAGIARVSSDTQIPVIFGVLTTDTVDQALDRAGGEHGNKGDDAAVAAIEMANLLRALPQSQPVPAIEKSRG